MNPDAQSLNVADALLQMLLQKEINTCFQLPGSQVIHFLSSKVLKKFKVVDMVHESHGVYMAGGYAAASGRAALVLTAGGPGVLNTVCALSHLSKYSFPCVMISGTVSKSGRISHAFQDINVFPVIQKVVKSAVRLTEPANLDRVKDLVELTLKEPAGPVYLEVPIEIQKLSLSTPQLKIRHSSCTHRNISLKHDRKKMLKSRKRVVVIAGERFLTNPALKKTLKTYLQKYPVAVVAPYGIKGVHLHELKLVPLLHPEKIFQQDVLVVTAGVGKDWRIKALLKGLNTEVLRIESCEIDSLFKTMNRNLLDGEWVQALEKYEHHLIEEYVSTGDSNPAVLLQKVAKVLCEPVNLVADGGDASVLAECFFPSGLTLSFAGPGPLWNIGAGLPTAIGMWVASGKKTLLITGDGSMGMSFSEIFTLKKLNANVKILVLNDASWGLIKKTHGNEGKSIQRATELDVRLYGAAAKALGISGTDVDIRKVNERLLARFFRNNGPAVINVFTGNNRPSHAKLLIQKALEGYL